MGQSPTVHARARSVWRRGLSCTARLFGAKHAKVAVTGNSGVTFGAARDNLRSTARDAKGTRLGSGRVADAAEAEGGDAVGAFAGGTPGGAERLFAAIPTAAAERPDVTIAV